MSRRTIVFGTATKKSPLAHSSPKISSLKDCLLVALARKDCAWPRRGTTHDNRQHSGQLLLPSCNSINWPCHSCPLPENPVRVPGMYNAPFKRTYQCVLLEQRRPCLPRAEGGAHASTRVAARRRRGGAARCTCHPHTRDPHASCWCTPYHNVTCRPRMHRRRSSIAPQRPEFWTWRLSRSRCHFFTARCFRRRRPPVRILPPLRRCCLRHPLRSSCCRPLLALPLCPALSAGSARRGGCVGLDVSSAGIEAAPGPRQLPRLLRTGRGAF